jgi:hypothetical protein
LLLLAFARALAFIEQPDLAKRRRFGIRALLQERLRVGQAGKAVTLGDQTEIAGVEFQHLRFDDAEFGLRLGGVEPHKNLALPHPIAVLDVDLGDDAAIAVLHLLDVALDDEGARCDDGTGDVGGGGPAAEPEHQTGHGQRREYDVRLDRKRAVSVDRRRYRRRRGDGHGTDG